MLSDQSERDFVAAMMTYDILLNIGVSGSMQSDQVRNDGGTENSSEDYQLGLKSYMLAKLVLKGYFFERDLKKAAKILLTIDILKCKNSE